MNREETKAFLSGIDRDLVEKFLDFHELNPEVFTTFCQLAAQMKATGKKTYGARTIIEMIRWEEDLKTEGDVFKFNNDFSPLYARLLMGSNPEFKGFFEVRKMKPVRQTSWEELRRQGLVS